MVAIVSGNSLGLSLGSLATLGQGGLIGTAGQGRNGEQSFVNIANGNLVLQDRDDVLMGCGLDVQAVRTYNSQGLLTDDNGDNWNVGAFGQKVILSSGSVGTAGSTLTRTDRDGAHANAPLQFLIDQSHQCAKFSPPRIDLFCVLRVLRAGKILLSTKI